MRKDMAFTRLSVLKQIDKYLAGDCSLNDLEKFAANILFVDEESEIDKKEFKLIKKSIWFLHETKLPWNSYINRVDLQILHHILANINDQDLAIRLIYILEFRVTIVEIINLYLSGNISDSVLKQKIQDQSKKEVVPLLIKLIYNNRKNKNILGEIIKDLNKGKIDHIVQLINI